MAGTVYGRTTSREVERIMTLSREGLSYATIAERVGRTSRTVSRIVKKEREKLAKLVERA